jgi:ABC-2 type transport system permease protein
MAVYKRSYKFYDGPRTAAGMRFSVLTRFSLSTLFQSRIFTGFVVLCMIPQLVGAAHIYFSHSSAAQYVLNMHLDSVVTIDNAWFATFLGIQAWLGFIIVAAAAPGTISRDLANQALQLYLSRPLSRAEYMLGKLSVLAVLLSFFTWIPGLLLFGLQASLAGNGWVWQNFYLVGAILVSGWLWIAVVSLFSLALSVWVRWRVLATGLIVGSIFLLPGFGLAINAVMRTSWGNLLNLSYVLQVIWASLFRLDTSFRRAISVDQVPLWSAWAAVLTVCAFSLLLINRRLKAREVVTG